MKPFFLFCVWAVLATTNTLWAQESFDYPQAIIVAPKGDIRVDVADTPESRRQGLGFRLELPPGRGMLFVFDERKPHPFWMKHMRIPIDIIWLDNYTVVHVESHVPPPENITENLPLYGPNLPSNFVLEVTAGYAKVYGIEKGTKLQYQF